MASRTNIRARVMKTAAPSREKVIERLVNDSFGSGKLNLSNYSLSQIPEQLFEGPSSSTGDKWWECVPLTRLVAADNNIESLDSRLETYLDLVFVDLHGNRLESFPSVLLALTNVTNLNLSKNFISIIPDELFNLPNLTELNLSHNKLTAMNFSFMNVKLSVLNLEKNEITIISGDLGKTCPNLTKLNLSGNKLTQLDIAWNSLQKLVDLDLSHNLLESPLFLSPTSLPFLTRLDLKYNNLTTLNASVSTPSLKDLILSFNKSLTSVSAILTSCLNLESLDIRDDNFNEIPVEVLSLSNLRRLDISNNNINKLPPELGLLIKIDSLMLTGNPLRGIPAGISSAKLLKSLRDKIVVDESVSNSGKRVSGLVAAKVEEETVAIVDPHSGTLDLTGKNIEVVGDSVVATAGDNVKSLILKKNKIRQFPSLDLPKLQFLDLSSNQIPTVLSVTNTYPNLVELNLSFNKLEAIPVLPFSTLTILLLNGNKISEINLDALDSLKQLSVLDLTNNCISSIPNELGLYRNIKNLGLVGNLFRVPRRAILDKGTEAVLQYLRDRIAQ